MTDRDKESRDMIYSFGNKIDYGRTRATDMTNNRHIYMPSPETPSQEALNQTWIDTWHTTQNEYMKLHCAKNGTQHSVNLTPTQQTGLMSITKKIHKQEIMIVPADKGKKLVAIDEATYVRMAQEHIANNRPITEHDVNQSQRILNVTSKPLVKIFNVGISHSEKNHFRCWDNSASEACEPAKLKLLPKIHKLLKENGDPQSRPLVVAHIGVSTRAGDLVAKILEPMTTLTRPQIEDLSTEEAIAQLDEAADTMRRREINNAAIASLDVKALYPSIPHLEASQEVARFVEESQDF